MAQWYQKNRFFGLSVLIFLISRIWVIQGYGAYITDLVLYQKWAEQGIGQGLSAYTDFHYPYPPLSLGMIYFPYFFGQEFWPYREAFHWMCLAIDLIGLLLLLGFVRQHLIKQFRWSESSLVLVSFLVSGLGLLQGHLLYDRLDIVVGLLWCAFMVGMVMRSPWFLLGGMWFGVVFKIAPLLWFFPFLLGHFSLHPKNYPNVVSSLIRFGGGFLFVTGITFLFMNGWSEGTLMESLSDHSLRGIQIESTWASPWMLAKAWNSADSVQLVTNYGSQNLANLPQIVVWFSKWLGFALIGYWTVQLFRIVKNGHKLGLAQLTLWMVFFPVLTLATQRVLSPQYFIWLIPGLALSILICQSWVYSLAVGLLYALTYVGFDLGYWDFVKFSPGIVVAVSARNAILVAITLYLARIKLWKIAPSH